MREDAHHQSSNHPSVALCAKGLRGVLLPCPTPFDAAGELNLSALRSNIGRWSATGIVGYAVLGSTGERVHLDEQEYRQAIGAARAAVPREVDALSFIVGVGQQSTRGTLNEVRMATVAGANAVLVITPHFYRSAITQEALVAHYRAVADVSPVPVILYSMPALTGIKIEPETVAQLSQHENIIGLKDSAGDVGGLRRTVELVRASSLSRDDFVILTGNGTVLFDALRAGADGAILAVGCVVPELCIAIFRAVKAGENERAAALQEKLTPLAQAVTTKYGIGGLKAALDMIGFVGGAVRAPLRPPDEEGRSEIGRLLENARVATTEYAVETAEV